MTAGENEPSTETELIHDPLDFESFKPHVESTFRLPDEQLELRLEEASTVGQAPKSGGRIKRQAFSLLFHGPAEPLLDQGIRRVEHEKLGKQDLFLVPVGGAEDGGFLYEAVFT